MKYLDIMKSLVKKVIKYSKNDFCKIFFNIYIIKFKNTNNRYEIY